MLRGSRASAGKKRDVSNALLDDLARTYAIPLKLYFSRRVRNQSDVPDLVQDVLLRLSKTSDLSSVSKPENYLFTTAASALRDKARRDSVRYRDQHVIFDVGKHSGSDFSPERICAGREALVALQGVLKSLPERTRDVFVLRVFEEQKTMAVAEALKLSTRAVEMHYAKALAQIAAVLSEYRYE